MNSLYDVQKLLQKYGTIIYTGNRNGDLQLLEMEVTELRKKGFITSEEFIIAKQLIHQEKNIK